MPIDLEFQNWGSYYLERSQCIIRDGNIRIYRVLLGAKWQFPTASLNPHASLYLFYTLEVSITLKKYLILSKVSTKGLNHISIVETVGHVKFGSTDRPELATQEEEATAFDWGLRKEVVLFAVPPCKAISKDCAAQGVAIKAPEGRRQFLFDFIKAFDSVKSLTIAIKISP